jgi:hypothetical protein
MVPPMGTEAVRFLVLWMAGWIHSRQLEVIDFLREENRVLREQIGGRRLRFTDDQRRRLAVKGPDLSSIVRDKFIILDPMGTEIGYAEEQGASVLRRFFPFLTSKHAIFIDGNQVAYIKQRFRFFTKEFEVDLQPTQLDPRFVLAVALLALMAEARREDRG